MQDNERPPQLKFQLHQPMVPKLKANVCSSQEEATLNLSEKEGMQADDAFLPHCFASLHRGFFFAQAGKAFHTADFLSAQPEFGFRQGGFCSLPDDFSFPQNAFFFPHGEF